MHEPLLLELLSRPRGVKGCQGNTGDMFIAKAYPLQAADEPLATLIGAVPAWRKDY